MAFAFLAPIAMAKMQAGKLNTGGSALSKVCTATPNVRGGEILFRTAILEPFGLVSGSRWSSPGSKILGWQ
jgi:hypothetical protein